MFQRQVSCQRHKASRFLPFHSKAIYLLSLFCMLEERFYLAYLFNDLQEQDIYNSHFLFWSIELQMNQPTPAGELVVLRYCRFFYSGITYRRKLYVSKYLLTLKYRDLDSPYLLGVIQPHPAQTNPHCPTIHLNLDLEIKLTFIAHKGHLC